MTKNRAYHCPLQDTEPSPVPCPVPCPVPSPVPILFSNDAFGQHLATEKLFNDQVDQCDLFNESIKYFANILNPFNPILRKKLAEITALNLPIEIIATSHGVIWRDNPLQIVTEWANDFMFCRWDITPKQGLLNSYRHVIVKLEKHEFSELLLSGGLNG